MSRKQVSLLLIERVITAVDLLDSRDEGRYSDNSADDLDDGGAHLGAHVHYLGALVQITARFRGPRHRNLRPCPDQNNAEKDIDSDGNQCGLTADFIAPQIQCRVHMISFNNQSGGDAACNATRDHKNYEQREYREMPIMGGRTSSRTSSAQRMMGGKRMAVPL